MTPFLIIFTLIILTGSAIAKPSMDVVVRPNPSTTANPTTLGMILHDNPDGGYYIFAIDGNIFWQGHDYPYCPEIGGPMYLTAGHHIIKISYDDGIPGDFLIQEIGIDVTFNGNPPTQVPEFPSMVLPVATIIGLVVVIGRKKLN